jgi:copper chaperone
MNQINEITYTVLGISCAHCTQAVSSELEQVEGVDSVTVDLDTKRVVVSGGRLDETALRAAIDRAGYEAA